MNKSSASSPGPSVCFGAVLTLLIIGCANVSILLLARGTARQHEFAVRASVGAGPKRWYDNSLQSQLYSQSLEPCSESLPPIKV